MRHKRKLKKLSRTRDQRRSLLSNQVSNLLFREEITTTLPKAKEMVKLAERMITLAKDPSVHHRRLVRRVVKDRQTVNKLFSVVAPRYQNQKGGYTKIVKIGYRRGDGALICKVKLV
ncbi:50S ribosomal protein L17 [Candidatus Aerophobetes bacterium]|uniref:Large ribosomal subunit protein bL17 n=1 Tax=Aerophobetes bacterium TaxID=2030807 RepID=A0A7V0MYM7_UNCAE|nr:50S ribosomal protein L17 [Candidatus Aerophobetes bacterium]HDN84479.1 50S ribosomal protein L17 [Candidatus Aerophobetes bacterium]